MDFITFYGKQVIFIIRFQTPKSQVHYVSTIKNYLKEKLESFGNFYCSNSY